MSAGGFEQAKWSPCSIVMRERGRARAKELRGTWATESEKINASLKRRPREWAHSISNRVAWFQYNLIGCEGCCEGFQWVSPGLHILSGYLLQKWTTRWRQLGWVIMGCGGGVASLITWSVTSAIKPPSVLKAYLWPRSADRAMQGQHSPVFHCRSVTKLPNPFSPTWQSTLFAFQHLTDHDWLKFVTQLLCKTRKWNWRTG